jgi:RNA polymerase sigma-70 factor (family 1)
MPYEDEQLLHQLAQDSAYAFQLIFDRYRNHIYRVALSFLKTPAAAEEVVQDVFIKLWYHRKNLTEIQSLESWLFVVAKNVTLNQIKKNAHEWIARNKYSNQHPESECSTEQTVDLHEYQAWLNQALSKLPEQQRKVYQMARMDGLSYKEIADVLNLSPLTVKKHMARALEYLRKSLKNRNEHWLVFILLANIS